MADVPAVDPMASERRLDVPPPRPPGKKAGLMQMAAGPSEQAPGLDQSSPAIQAMAAMGAARNALMKLSAMLPPLAPGIQQVIQGLESVVPQMVADVVAGNPPGSGGAMMGSPQADQSPAAPPTQTGMP